MSITRHRPEQEPRKAPLVPQVRNHAIARVSSCLLSLCLAGTIGCHGSNSATGEPAPSAESPDDPIWFRDDTAAVGLDFVHEAGPVGQYPLPQIIGSGAALFDFDNDGRMDLYLVPNGGRGLPPPHKTSNKSPAAHVVAVVT